MVKTVMAVVAYAVTAALVLGVFALLPVDSRATELDRFVVALPAIIAGIPGLLAYLQSKQAKQALDSHAADAAANAQEMRALLDGSAAPATDAAKAE